ncbi:hypothetical protein GCM10029964_055940 [Kibdelosporangium lantanae]
MTLTDTADTSPAKPVDGADGLGHLYRQMMGQGRNDLAMDLLRVASKLRNTFDRSATADRSGVVTLATGSDDPVLVCVPSFAAMSGEYHYTRLAKHLRGNRSTTVSLHPGFGTDNAVPVDLATLVDVHVRAVLNDVRDRAFVVAGHSAGGLIAHALVTELERVGRPAAGLVLLDTPWPDDLNGGVLTALARSSCAARTTVRATRGSAHG